MDLKLDGLHTYMHCPAKYKFKYIDHIQMEEPKSITYKKAIHDTVNYFFYSAMGGTLPKASAMKDKWASIWEKTGNAKDPKSIILSTTPGVRGQKNKPAHDKYLIQGFEMINNFYHFNNSNPGIVIAVDMDYRLPIENINLLGKFELIREILDAEDGKRYIEIVDFKTNEDNVDPFLVKNDLNLSLASMAFRNLFQATEDRSKYHYLKTGRDIITVRRQDDFNRAKAVVKGVANGIKNKDFYPRQSFMCKSCEFKDVCDRVKY